MTPLRLELSGFSCFRKPVSIDFSALELFAISGPTGSGKTTLLDALTYALYGQTARLGSKGLDVLLSPGLMQMYVVLEFKTSRGTFKVTRTVDKRASGSITRNTRIEELQPSASYRQLAESEKLKEADAKLVELVGLDYDGFTRSVLLPQGAFDEFLRGDSGKRRKLLVSLLGLDKVEAMQKEAGRIAREADLQQKALTERLEQDYAGATPERREALREEVVATKKLVEKLSSQQTKVTETLKELEGLKLLVEELEKVDHSMLQLKALEPSIKEKQEKLELAKRVQQLLPQIEQVQRFQGKQSEIRQSLTVLEANLETKLKDFAASELELQQAQQHRDERLPILTEKLTDLAEVRPLIAQLKSRGGRLELAQQANPEIKYSDAAWEALQEQQANLPSLKQLEQQFRQTQRDLALSKTEFETLSSTVSALEVQVKSLIEQGKDARVHYTEAKEGYEAALYANQAIVLRGHLHEGDLCPVCAQVIKRLPEQKVTGLEPLKQAMELAEEQLDSVKTAYRNAEAKLSGLKERQVEKQGSQEKLERDLGAHEKSLEASLKRLKVNSVDDLEKATIQERSSLLAALALSIHQKTDGLNPETLEPRLQKEQRDLEEQLRAAEKKVQDLQTKLVSEKTRKEYLATQLIDLDKELELAHSSLAKALQEANFNSVETVQAAHLSDLEMKGLEAEISGFSSQLESRTRRAVELQDKLAGRTLDSSQYEHLKAKERELKQELSETQTRLGRLEAELSLLETQLEKAKSLEKERAIIQRRQDTYRALSQDLQGNRFQEYLLSQVQAKLAIRASHILRDVTDGRYDLRLIEGDYQVKDAWIVGETRSAKTLSGGETFIASLALALALSDTIAGSHALGALFLDEGFGTLDPLTLDAVAAVLENLTKEGRMVGIITHVSALTERLPARLSVSKDKEGSSISWDIA